MVGHRSERHLRFGWASARLDDLVNWPAARLAALAAIAWAPAVGGDRRAAWSAAWRDGAAHPSPNAGRIEGAFAGALGVRLGGLNVRHAQVPPAHALPTEIARLSERQAFGIRGEAWGHDVLDELDAYIAPAVGISAPSGATDASGPNVTADDFRALALGFDSASVSTRGRNGRTDQGDGSLAVARRGAHSRPFAQASRARWRRDRARVHIGAWVQAREDDTVRPQHGGERAQTPTPLTSNPSEARTERETTP
jgi:CobD/Cbib protein